MSLCFLFCLLFGLPANLAANHIQVYCRSVQENLSLLKDLKLIWHLDGDQETALVFAKNNSPYAPFSGLPFALEAVNENF